MFSLGARELIKQLRYAGITNEQVLDAIQNTPREQFISDELVNLAYSDIALPLEYGQTISQPYIVALMSQALLENGHCRQVLEVGTGSGYQAAILSQLVEHVYTTERLEALFQTAKKRLTKLGYHNISVFHKDGFDGLSEHAPYDGIIVTAAALEIPPKLMTQLVSGGRMIIPVGGPGAQDLLAVTRHDDQYEIEKLEKVVFVPMLSGTESIKSN